MGRFDALLHSAKPVPTTMTPHEDVDSKEASKRASLLAKKQTDKEANQQGSELVYQQTSKEVSEQANLPTNQQTSKSLKKFGSYLTEESLKQLKRIAFETERKDYEILQDAVDLYLEKKKEQ